MSRTRSLLSLFVLAGLLAGLVPLSLGAQAPSAELARRVVRLAYGDALDELAGRLDVWEIHPEDGTLVALVSAEEEARLRAQGYAVTVERIVPDGVEAPLDPRFYYYSDEYPNPNGLYMVDFLTATNALYPDLTEIIDIGTAWQGENGGYKRPLYVLRITNEDTATYGPIADKPTFVLHANVHAREVTTPEMAIRYIKHLLEGYRGQGGYGVDADATWLVDWNVVYVMISANPDGHRVNEADTNAYRRKNMDNDDGCSDPNSWGVDLNRNHNFKWGCCGGSSGDPCDETYRGVARSSEPETFYFQNFITTNNILRDQNGPNGPDEIPPAAPLTATGVLLSLHTYADEVLWPWSFTGDPPANGAELVALGRKLGFFTGYEPTGFLYTVDGDTHDWSYGQLGVASFAYEIGPNTGSCGGFFPAYGCEDGIDGMPRDFWSENRPSFVYLHKVARTPYITVYGPDAIDLAVVPPVVTPGTVVEVQATLVDQRYGGDPQRPVTAAEYLIGGPGEDGAGTPMFPVDGAWGDTFETVTATLDTAGLPTGASYILVHGRNDQGQWGPYTAVFVHVFEPGVAPVIEGYVDEAEAGAPVADALVTAGIFQDVTDATGYYSMTVLSGTYDMLVEASGYAPASASGVAAHDGETVQQDFTLFAYCDIFTDNVEAGNPGWAADWPWGIVTETAHSPEHSWTDSPGRDYYNFMNASLTSPAFDLSDFQGMALSFWHVYELASGDYGYVEYSTDGGATWTEAASYGGIASWSPETIYFPPALDNQPQVHIRFRFESDASGGVADGWHVDDVVLQGGGPGCLPCDPVAELDFDYLPALPLVGEVIAFTGTATGTAPIAFTWDLGDGALAGGITATHAYTAAGVYTVTLAAENCGGTATAEHTVTVVPSCTAVEVAGVAPTIVGCAVTLTAELTGSAPFDYLWGWGDGMTSTAALPTHTYTQTGIYSGTLEVWNCAGAGHDSYAFTVQVECAAPRWVAYLPVVFK